jgi:hypothetical protein
MTRELAIAASFDDIVTSAISHLAHVFDAEGMILLKSPDGTMHARGAEGDQERSVAADSSIADWVFTQNKVAGVGTNTLPSSDAMYLPLNGTRGTVGVLVVSCQNRGRLLMPEQRHLLEVFANQIAVARRAQRWYFRHVAAASIGLVTFVGFFWLAYAPGLAIERAMRISITAAVIAMYVATVGITMFFSAPRRAPGDPASDLPALAKTMVDSFQTVVTVVVAFYFTSSAVVEGIQRRRGVDDPASK